jgi:ribosomal protein L34E
MKPAKRTRAQKRTRIVVPGGKTKFHFRKKKVGKAVCPCGEKLIRPSLRAIEMQKLPKVQRRSNRALPNLCPKCARETLRKKARGE